MQEDVLIQKKANFNLGFKSPVAILKWNECASNVNLAVVSGSEAEKMLSNNTDRELHRHYNEGGNIKER